MATKKVDFNTNLEKLCRLCLNTDDCILDIFNADIPLKLMACTSVEVHLSDSLPKGICKECRIQLEKSYCFRKRSQQSDRKLRKHLRLMSTTKYNKTVVEECEMFDSIECPIENSSITLREQESEMPLLLSETKLKNNMEKEREYNSEAYRKISESILCQSSNQSSEKSFQLVYTDDENEDNDFDSTYYLIKNDGNTNESVQYNDTIKNGSDETISDFDSCKSKDEIGLDNCTLEESKGNKLLYNLNVEFSECTQLLGGEDNKLSLCEESVNTNRNAKLDFDNGSEVERTKLTSEEIILIELQADPLYSETIVEEKSSTKNQELKIFKCTFCPQAFTRRYLLLRHKSVHVKSKGYCCKFCDKWFACKSSMDRHVRVHTGEKPFECPECHRRFIQKEILKRHIITHTGVRPHKCPNCERSFVQKQLLRQHINLKHTANPVLEMHECFLCPKSFCHASGLSRHLLIHSGVSYNCKICNKKFNDKSAVKRHTSTVHNGQLSS